MVFPTTPARLAVPAAMLASALALVSSSCAPERGAPLEPVKVGTIGSTSGALATFGSALQDAIVLAFENVNAAGGVFDGRPVELIIKDSTSDGDTAADVAAELIDEGVVAIIGPETSGQSEKVLAVAENADVPMVSCCATSTSLSAQNIPNGGFFFRTAPSDALQGKALAYVAQNGIDDGGLQVRACSQAAFFSRPDAYGSGFKVVFEANYPGGRVNGLTTSIIANGTFPSDAPNAGEIDASAASFANAIVVAADPGEEVCVVFITFGFEGARLAKGIDGILADSGLSYHYLTGDGAQEGAFLAEIASSTTLQPKIIGTVPTHAENAAYEEFAVAFEARHGSPPPAYSSQAFDAAFVTALAITKARSTTGVDVRNALFSVSGREGGVRFENGNFFGEIAARILDGDDVDYVGPSGELTFDAVGDVQGDYVVWTLGPVDGELNFLDRSALPVSLFAPQ